MCCFFSLFMHMLLFVANILLKLVVSHVFGSVHQLVSHVLGAVH